jgi:hypothetical protein
VVQKKKGIVSASAQKPGQVGGLGDSKWSKSG